MPWPFSHKRSVNHVTYTFNHKWIAQKTPFFLLIFLNIPSNTSTTRTLMLFWIVNVGTSIVRGMSFIYTQHHRTKTQKNHISLSGTYNILPFPLYSFCVYFIHLFMVWSSTFYVNYFIFLNIFLPVPNRIYE